MSPFLLTPYSTQRYEVKPAKKGGKDVEAVPRKLNQLIQVKARATATETLEVVQGPIQNMRVVMDSKQAPLSYILQSIDYFNLDNNVSPNAVQGATGTFCWRQRASSVSD